MEQNNTDNKRQQPRRRRDIGVVQMIPYDTDIGMDFGVADDAPPPIAM